MARRPPPLLQISTKHLLTAHPLAHASADGDSFVNVFALDVRVLVIILGDAPIIVGVLPLPQQLRKVHVVRDDDELEVLLVAAAVHDVDEAARQAVGVWSVQVGRGLVQREDAAGEGRVIGISCARANQNRCFFTSSASFSIVQSKRFMLISI